MKRISIVGSIAAVAAVTIGVGAVFVGQTIFASDDKAPTAGLPAVVSQPQSAPNTTSTQAEAPARKPYIGVSVQDSPNGVILSGVLEGGPAVGRLQKGDILLSVNGQPVKTVKELSAAIGSTKEGDVVSVEFKRGDATSSVRITVGSIEAARPDPIQKFRPQPAPAPIAGGLEQLMAQMKGMHGKFVRGEVVVEAEDGTFKTIRAVNGTASNFNAAAGTFTLTPRDGSAPINYTINPDTIIDMRRAGDLGGLNTTDRTLVIDVNGEVKLIVQGEMDMAKLGAMGIPPPQKQPGAPAGPVPQLFPLPPKFGPDILRPGPVPQAPSAETNQLLQRLLNAYPQLLRPGGVTPELKEKLSQLAQDDPRMGEAIKILMTRLAQAQQAAPKVVKPQPAPQPPVLDVNQWIERLFNAYPELKRPHTVSPELRQKLEQMARDNPDIAPAVKRILSQIPAQTQ
ncbi:MAG: PDZ domain-containing protein [SAR202 cluster bacterium]|nr:PDZ domain-containing protein [SAR202 cluster bacterium]